jgi:hypothetical protein
MKTDDLIHIICRLIHPYYDFENEQSAFTYTFSKRNYNITFKRMKNKVVSFTLEDAGEVLDEAT